MSNKPDPFARFVPKTTEKAEPAKKSDPFSRFVAFKPEPTSLPARAAKEFASSALGSYGNLASAIGLDQETPGYKARLQRESQLSPEQLIYETDDDVIPSYSRLPKSEELLKALGGVTEAESPIERFVSRAGGAAGSALSFGGASGILPAVAGSFVGQGAEELGASPLVGTVLDIATSAGASIPQSFNKSLQNVTKPSGISARRFEKLKKPTSVTPERYAQIINTVETDARQIADKILDTNKTRVAMKNIPEFVQQVEENFDKVRDLARQLPNTFDDSKLISKFNKINQKRLAEGFPDSAAEKTYRNEIKYLMKKNLGKDFTAEDLEELYRKNNRDVKKTFDRSGSSSVNDAKQAAILDFQKAISETFEEQLPDTEFTNLFKLNNKQYSDIAKLRVIDDYMDKVFQNGKVDFKAARQYFEKNKVRDAMKQLYGKESVDAFTQLQKDFLSYEDTLKLIKSADSKNIKLRDFAPFLLGKGIGGIQIGSKVFEIMKENLLDKPQVMMKWSEAIKDIKRGAFTTGMRKLEEISKDINNEPEEEERQQQ